MAGAGALQCPEMRRLLESAAGPGSRPARPQVAIVFVCPAGLKTLAAFSQPVRSRWHSGNQHLRPHIPVLGTYLLLQLVG
jgi:hypothetical protein